MWTARGISLLVLVAFAWACRPECEEAACDAARAPRGGKKIGQGVAGVIAYRTDACVDGCCECSWDQAELSLWRSVLPVDEAQAFALVASGSPQLSFTATRAYEQALEPGDYMLCHQSSCAALHIERGTVFTVNLQMRYGPASLIVFGPGDRKARDDLVFDLNKE